MSRYGDEMIQDLAKLLKVDNLTKTAAKKEEDKKEEKKEEKKEKCKDCNKEECSCKEDAKKEKEKEDAKKEKAEKKEEKKDKKSKKAELMYGIVNDLVKLANELDDAGDQASVEAANLVDDALKVIMKTLDK